jgi:hypothetical protein
MKWKDALSWSSRNKINSPPKKKVLMVVLSLSSSVSGQYDLHQNMAGPLPSKSFPIRYINMSLDVNTVCDTVREVRGQTQYRHRSCAHPARKSDQGTDLWPEVYSRVRARPSIPLYEHVKARVKQWSGTDSLDVRRPAARPMCWSHCHSHSAFGTAQLPGYKHTLIIDVFRPTYAYHKHKFREELIVYFPWYDKHRTENDTSINSSIVACIFVAAVTFITEQLPSNERGNTHRQTDWREWFMKYAVEMVSGVKVLHRSVQAIKG